jgi:nucleoside-diphosphate-sugar epimerase
LIQGSKILSSLVSLPSFDPIHALGRRAPKISDAKINNIIEPSSDKWGAQIAAIKPAAQILFSALGTTRAQAGGFENQHKIDYDLNLDVAKAAKAAGVKVYVLISSSGSSANSRLGYPKMKGELEEAVKKLDFDSTIILRPGLIVGGREDSRPSEFVVRKIAGVLGAISKPWLTDAWAQDAEVIGRAAVSAGEKALTGEAPKIWMLGQSDIVRLGRTEWKE